MAKENLGSIATPPSHLQFNSSKDVEELVLLVRAYKQAARDIADFPKGKMGAISTFPICFEQEHEGTVHCWAAKTSIEIGSILPIGEHVVDLSLKTYTSFIKGSFLIAVIDSPISSLLDAHYVDVQGDDEVLLQQMPSSRTFLAKPYADLKASVTYMGKRANEAKENLHEMFMPLFKKEARKSSRRIDPDEVISICHLALESLLDRYASSKRPRSSFKFALMGEVKRSVEQAIAKQAGETIQVAYLKSLLWHNPQIKTEEELKKIANDRYSASSYKEAIHNHNTISLYLEEISHLLPHHDIKTELTSIELFDKLKTFARVAGLNERQAEAWAYRIGAFDEPHTVKETLNKFDMTVSEFKALEYQLLSVFSTSGKTVSSVENRATLKKAIKEYLLNDEIALTRGWLATRKADQERNG